MKVGYLPSASQAAQALKLEGVSVEPYGQNVLYDALLYSGTLDNYAQDTTDAAAPLLMLNLAQMDEQSVAQALHDRAHSKLFQ